MKIVPVEQGSDEWRDYRRGKISGTMLADLYAKRGGRKLGFYKVIAEKLAIEPDDESVMDRGMRLEDEARVAFETETGKKIEQVGICVHDDYPDIINSPDGLIKNGNKYTEAVEIKCLNSATHIKAYVEGQVPDEYEAQKLQYFIVNPDLQKLYFVFYDPRFTTKPFFYLTVEREEVKDLVKRYFEYQVEQIQDINAIVESLAF